MAKRMFNLEAKYEGRVNFCVVNGDKVENKELLRQFHVDGIPHIALVNSSGKVGTGKRHRHILLAKERRKHINLLPRRFSLRLSHSSCGVSFSIFSHRTSAASPALFPSRSLRLSDSLT